MRPIRATILSLAVAMTLTACGSGSSDPADSAPPTPVSSSERAPSGSAAPSSPASGAAGSSVAGASGSASATAPAALDPATTVFYQAYCNGVRQSDAIVPPTGEGGAVIADRQAAIAATYERRSAALQGSATTLELTPAPTFAQGDGVKQASVQRFQTLAEIYTRGATSVRAAAAADDAQLRTATDAVAAEISQAQQTATANTPDPPREAQQAIVALPECAEIFGG